MADYESPFPAAARWISDGSVMTDFCLDYPKQALMLRKTFDADDVSGEWRVLISGLGFHEVYLNGQKLGDSYLVPGFSAYDKRVYCNEYEATAGIRKGKNTIGVLLGNGWYNTNAATGWGFEYAPWRGMPKLCLAMYRGEIPVLCSDDTWRTSRSGPIYFNDLRLGEYYDARLEDNFFQSSYRDEDWETACCTAPPGGHIQKESMPPVKIVERIPPISVTRYDGKLLYDFGVNLAGCAEIDFSGECGRTVTLRYGERLREGKLYTEEIARYTRTGGFQTDRYTFRGGARERWHARFVYHGFRYVEAEGISDENCGQVTALVLRTAFESIGGFRCGDELLNSIYEAGLRSICGNYHSIPTDCPHREKNGWTGDAQLSAEQSVKHYDMLSSYRKWMLDFEDAQRPSGQLPATVPTGGWGYNWGAGPAWDVALFEIPYECYLHYGDTELMKQVYGTAQRYYGYLESRETDGLVCFGLGDWCPPRTDDYRECDNTLSDSVYYCYITDIIAIMAELSGARSEACRYQEKADRIRTCLVRRYEQSGTANQSISALSLLLKYHIIRDGSLKTRIAERLNTLVVQSEYRMLTGILGAKSVYDALSENGYPETAFRLLKNKEFPSYGNWIRNGATTFYEDWEGSFSLNHHMFSGVLSWMIKFVAGLRPDAPGFRRFTVQPAHIGEVGYAESHYRCPYGTIAVESRAAKDSFTVRLTVPEHTECTLILPSGESKLLKGGEYEFRERRHDTL